MVVSKVKTIQIVDFENVASHVNWLNNNRVNRHDYRTYPAKVIFLNFSHSRFLKPYHIAPLACLIHEYQTKGFIIKIKKTTSTIQRYLESFGFDRFCNSLDDKALDEPIDQKTFPLWLIEEKGKDFYTIQVKDYFEKNHFAGHDLFVLGNSLGELMNNVFDHSQSKIPGYSFTQYNTKSDSIITCVCDFGIGIPNSVNRFLTKSGQIKLPNNEALIKAFELSFSAHTKPHNRGFGWNTVFGNLKKLHGKLLIISNNTIFVLYTNGKISTHLIQASFPGTLIVITLNASNLPLKEENSDELELF